MDSNRTNGVGRQGRQTKTRTSAGSEHAETARPVPSASMSIAFRHLSTYALGSRIDYQKTITNLPLSYIESTIDWILRRPKQRLDIIYHADGFVKPGETLAVLGRPGSGCSTFLKTLAGQTYGFFVDSKSHINYQGLTLDQISSEFRGRAVYQAENDVHFPHLTVKQTLNLAVKLRHSEKTLESVPSETVVAWILESLDLTKAGDTKVGNDLVLGISGGERKRTSIAEILASGETWLQCWDNSSRGLDSSTALAFVKLICNQAQQNHTAAIVSLYQASQDIFNLVDKVLLLYEGRQIFFGKVDDAVSYFENLGFVKAHRANDPDFLTSITSPDGRIVAPGFESTAPQTAIEFERKWLNSAQHAALLREIEEYDTRYPFQGVALEDFRHLQSRQKEWITQRTSPYIQPFHNQIRFCLTRSFQRMRQDAGAIIGMIVGNAVVSLILGSIFYNLKSNTDSFFGREVVIFFGVVMNISMGGFEGTMLWEHRPIVQKHYHYAFYRPIGEAISSMLSDVPNKIILSIITNTPYYFLVNLKRTPGAYFTYILFSFILILTGSMVWRADISKARNLPSSMPFGAALSTLFTLYAGFLIPFPYMKRYLRWFAYINPCYYGFESLMINEYKGREFNCSTSVPNGDGYEDLTPSQQSCSVFGANASWNPNTGRVNGTEYIYIKYKFQENHLWRNLPILLALMAAFCIYYLIATESVALSRSKGDIPVFRKSILQNKRAFDRMIHDEERRLENAFHIIRNAHSPKASISTSTTIRKLDVAKIKNSPTIMWNALGYEIKTGKQDKMILSDIDGWIEPGTLTVLMGKTGAGKTSLLNVLAGRAAVGVVSGYIGIEPAFEDMVFEQRIGYAQQQDLHLPTTTVREALEFSALLRQPQHIPRAERLRYVDTVIELLEMETFAEAMVGVPGEGLNLEQRKRLTIGVELAARPDLMIFLDEPTSGMDSDTAWSICTLLRKLADHGHTILCTLHQPSGLLMEKFDRLLLLDHGEQIYFGDIGESSRALIEYFEGNGATTFDPDDNPAEWMLRTISQPLKDGNTWVNVWKHSSNKEQIRAQSAKFKPNLTPTLTLVHNKQRMQAKSDTAPMLTQLYAVTKRAIIHDWRTPDFLWAKLWTTLFMALLNGISVYHADLSLQGVQNQFLSLFVFFTIFPLHVQLLLARYLDLRALYEAREGPSRVYSWKAFLASMFISEMPSQTIAALLTFVPWYFALGWQNTPNAQGSDAQRGGLIFLFVWMFMLWTQTFTQMLGSFVPNLPAGFAMSNALYILSVLFSGLLIQPRMLVKFWLFMYRASPISWYVSGILSTALSGAKIQCALSESSSEFSILTPPAGMTCSSFLEPFLSNTTANQYGAVLTEDTSTSMTQCKVCPIGSASSFLKSFNIYWDHRWRDFGICVAYVAINVVLMFVFYYLGRVPKGSKLKLTDDVGDATTVDVVDRRHHHDDSHAGHTGDAGHTGSRAV